MKDTSDSFCRILLDVLSRHGVRYAFCSPGSRNVPLLRGVFHREEMHPVMVADERTASFMACGYSLVSQNPVALICTSGTALLNYAPAVAEAFYQNIPLVVISADRPVQWIDQDDSQTLRQHNALGNFVKRSFDIPVAGDNPSDDMKWYVERIANEAVGLACIGKQGPVHINIQLDAPLNGVTDDFSNEPRLVDWISPDDWLPSQAFVTRLKEETFDKKILLLCGFMKPSHPLNKAIASLSRYPNLYIMAETLSNIHLPGNPYAVDSILSSVTRKELNELKPDIVITMGGALVSRKVKEFLRDCRPKEHWQVGHNHNLVDCFKSMTVNFEVEPRQFIKALGKALYHNERKSSSAHNLPLYAEMWKSVKDRATKRLNEYLQATGWSEFKALHTIFNSVPASYNIFVANGTPVRYAQLFCTSLTHGNFSNRGVSGIEGTTATAAGGSLAYNGPTLLISGDMAFSYDTGILGLDMLNGNFKIIVVNNNGGGIFRFISSTREMENREDIFAAHTSLPIHKLADAYGWQYFLADSEESLNNTLHKFLNSKEKGIMELKADPYYSADVLHDYLAGNDRPSEIKDDSGI